MTSLEPGAAPATALPGRLQTAPSGGPGLAIYDGSTPAAVALSNSAGGGVSKPSPSAAESGSGAFPAGGPYLVVVSSAPNKTEHVCAVALDAPAEVGQPAAGKATGARFFECKRCRWNGWLREGGRCPGCSRIKNARWRAAHPEADRAKNARWRRAHPEKITSKNLRWRQANREKVRARERAAWANRLEWLRSGDVTKAQLVALVERSGSRCAYCGVPVSVCVKPKRPSGFDHIVPRCAGGVHTIRNIVVCCLSCNRKKGKNPVPLNGVPAFSGEKR